jgi:tetratricopeptide (TPR) repeat protein
MPIPEEWSRFAPAVRPLAGTDQWNVFLSYRSVNRAWVLNLYDVLREFGLKVFLDQCVLKVGDELISRLQTALSSSQAGVLIWSDATRDSDWVSKEYQVLERMAAVKSGFTFVPVTLDNSELPAIIGNRIFVNFSDYPDGPTGGELLRLLHGIANLPLSAEAVEFATAQDEAAKTASASIRAAVRNKSSERLIELLASQDLPWRNSPALGCKAAQALIELGHNDDAILALQGLAKTFPRAVRPKQLLALALARRGKEGELAKAQEILGELYESGQRDPETLGIYGRTWMDRYAKSQDLDDLRSSRDYYTEAFERAPDDSYTGINAAAKSVLLGTPEDLERARKIAARVQALVGDAAHPNDYWKTATVGEVLLMQGRYGDAAGLYQAAVAMARGAVANHQSTWLQACRLMAKLQPSAADRALVRGAFADLPDCAA